MTMASGEKSARWSVFDGAKVFQEKPDALMADINTAIAAIEYRRATALLNFSLSSSPSPTANKGSDKNTTSMYDHCISEETYRTGCTKLAAGIDLDSSISSADLHACS